VTSESTFRGTQTIVIGRKRDWGVCHIERNVFCDVMLTCNSKFYLMTIHSAIDGCWSLSSSTSHFGNLGQLKFVS
jgi:hypothetical protein